MTRDPLLKIIVYPKSPNDFSRLTDALDVLRAEDPAISGVSQGSRAVVLGTNDEAQLEIVVDRLAREFHVEAHLSPVYIALKYTLTYPAEGQARFVSQSGGRGQYGHVRIRVTPRARGEGNLFVDETCFGSIPRQFIPAVEEGVTGALSRGLVDGYAIDDVEVAVYDGSYHEADSSPLAFKEAAKIAFGNAATRAGGAVLEPIMRVDISVPAASVSAVLSDLLTRRAHVHSRSSQRLEADVPLMELLGYTSALREMTRGAGQATMELAHYQILKRNDDPDDGGAGVREPRAPLPRPLRSSSESIEP